MERPSPKIQASDSILLRADPGKIFRVLLDLPSYKDWWPRNIRFELLEKGPIRVGTRLKISNQGLVSWVAEVTGIEEGRRIDFRYGQGAWEGTAGWTLSQEKDGTKVTYTIDIRPVPLWLRALSRLMDLGKMHSQQMRGILEKLPSRLREP